MLRKTFTVGYFYDITHLLAFQNKSPMKLGNSEGGTEAGFGSFGSFNNKEKDRNEITNLINKEEKTKESDFVAKVMGFSGFTSGFLKKASIGEASLNKKYRDVRDVRYRDSRPRREYRSRSREYERSLVHLIQETPELYEFLVLPHLQSRKFYLQCQWIFDVLKHKKDEDRIIFEDPDPENGLILAQDPKWSGESMFDMYCLAIIHKRMSNPSGISTEATYLFSKTLSNFA